MGVHVDTVTTEQRAVQVAVVPPSIAFVNRNDHQTAFRCFDIFRGCEYNFISDDRRENNKRFQN